MKKTKVSSQAVLKKQQLRALAVMGGIVAILGVITVVHVATRHHHKVVKQTPNLTGIVDSDFTQKDQESEELSEQDELTALKKAVHLLQQQAQQSSAQLTQVRDEKEKTTQKLQQLHSELVTLKAKEKATVKDKTSHSPLAGVGPASLASPSKAEEGASRQGLATNKTLMQNNEEALAGSPYTPGTLSINTISFHYAAADPLATFKDYVPSGTFARAVLLEGADANASVNGQSDTSPILLRLLDNGTMPNQKHSSLKGCFALASIYGDVSSERGEVRLTSLSCVKKDGAVIDTPVEGYLSYAGKDGIKGRVVMRNGKIIAWAGLSGFLSGFGKSLQQQQTTQSVSPLGVTSTVNGGSALRYGLYAGTGTALGKLSDYYIKRADQYHPIIEIGAGNIVTVVFQAGFHLTPLDERAAKQAERQVRAEKAKAEGNAGHGALIPEKYLKGFGQLPLGASVHE